MGLYIVKTLVDLMKGRISVVSEVGRGSEFMVILDFDVV
jgi:signal transduction histidine kinase